MDRDVMLFLAIASAILFVRAWRREARRRSELKSACTTPSCWAESIKELEQEIVFLKAADVDKDSRLRELEYMVERYGKWR